MTPVNLSSIFDTLKADGIDCHVLRTPGNNAWALMDFYISGYASLENATEHDVSFWRGKSESVTHANGYSCETLSRACAGLLFVPQKDSDAALEIFKDAACVVAVKEPYHAMVRCLEHFALECEMGIAPLGESTVHPSAVVEGTVGAKCFVGPGCVVMPGAKVGDGCWLEANVTVYPNVVIGEECVFQAGVVIGSRGFGFYEHAGERRMVPHLAGVRIGNRSSFGANTVVAAGFISPTTIGDDCHFDSMVQIAHNCVIGNKVFMASQTALGGTTVLEDGVQFAGGAKAAGHLTVGKNAIVTAKAGVTKNVAAGKTVAGFPAIDIDVWRRQVVELRLMAKKNLEADSWK